KLRSNPSITSQSSKRSKSSSKSNSSQIPTDAQDGKIQMKTQNTADESWRTVRRKDRQQNLTPELILRLQGSHETNKLFCLVPFPADCCVHLILACLFCEFLTLCNIVLDCATCGSCAGDDSCFCCCCASEECGDCDLPCDMDCGIIDACCESADCLEICMECCSLCFSS
uniref:MyoD family inhibitor n=1 Tax=Fundulus heteroclitus TaxID=8078 RepID=A0A3Q2PZS4_FUNHE